MGQTVYTKETVDLTTGEVTQKEIFRKHVNNQEQFVRAFIEDIGALAKCSGAEKSVVLCILKYLDYNTNEFYLSQSRRGDVCDCADLKLNTVNTAIARLLKKNILIKKSTNEYILNPKIFFYGKEIERSNIIRATITYIIDPNAD